MGGYRGQIRRACDRLGRHGRTFDYRDVMLRIPDGPYKPTEWQLIRFLERYDKIEVAVPGNRHNPQQYRLKRRGKKKDVEMNKEKER